MPFEFTIESREGKSLLTKVIPSKIASLNTERIKRIAEATAKDIEGTAREQIQTGKRSGRLYRKKSGRIHQASAPGEFPASDTGQLANSILSEAVSNGALVGSVVRHGLYMEEGTSRVAKRPWLMPSLQMNIPKLEQRLNKMLEEL